MLKNKEDIVWMGIDELSYDVLDYDTYHYNHGLRGTYSRFSVNPFLYLLNQFPNVIKNIPLASEIVLSIRRGAKRSFGLDMLKILEATDTKYSLLGTENLPSQGGFVVAMSHVQTSKNFPFDDLKVNPTWPFGALSSALQLQRGSPDYRVIMFSNLLKPNLRTKIASVYNCYPVQPHMPFHNDLSIRSASEFICNGGVVLITPEGITKRHLTKGQTGVARLSLLSNSPVLPVAFWEDDKNGDYEHVVAIGSPLHHYDYECNPESLRDYTDRIMNSIASQMPSKYRGQYS